MRRAVVVTAAVIVLGWLTTGGVGVAVGSRRSPADLARHAVTARRYVAWPFYGRPVALRPITVTRKDPAPFGESSHHRTGCGGHGGAALRRYVPMDMGIPSRRATEGAHIAAGIPVLPVAGGVRGSLAGHSAARRQAYTPGLRGVVAGYRLAGIEPDGDPLDQVVLKTRLAPAGGNPAVNLIVSSYLENFQPDTTPVLPDLLHPTQSAVNLGGFLQGKALLTDDAGNVLAIGSFLAEAFLDNSNHAVLQLTGSGLRGRLKGSFLLRKDGALNGSLTGSLSLPASARRQIAAHRGATMRSLKKIISVVTVRPQPMMGKAKTGTPNAPLHTGYGAAPTGQTHRSVPIWAIAAGAGAIIAFLLSGVLYWTGRETKPAA